MKTFHGDRVGQRHVRVVVRDGEKEQWLSARSDIVNHSPDGFNWGYGGSGPAQLAVAILAEVAGKNVAWKYHQRFKNEVVSNMPDLYWTMSEKFVLEWLDHAGYLGGICMFLFL